MIRKDIFYQAVCGLILVSQLFYGNFLGLNTRYLESFRRVRDQITPALVNSLLQEVPSASKERVQELARRYLSALARLNFASDIDVPADEGGNELRDSVLKLIDEMAKKLDIKDVRTRKLHSQLATYGTSSPIASFFRIFLSYRFTRGPFITRMNGQFIFITSIKNWIEGSLESFFTYHGYDIRGNQVNFSDPPNSLIIPSDYHKKDYRPFNDYYWDGLIWPKELLNWPAEGGGK